MNVSLIRVIIIQVIMCIIILILLFLFAKILFSVENEKRIKPFALDSKNKDSISLVDGLLNILIKIVKFLSKVILKSQVLKDYSEHFSKYLIYQKGSNINSADFISIKFLIMMFIQILYIFSTALKGLSFNIYGFILVSFISFFILDVIVIVLFNKKKHLIEEQLLQAIVIMNNAFKSGKNILQAIEIVKSELPSPIKEEFETIYLDLNYGLELSTVFNRFYLRVKVEEAKYITSSLALLSKTGGNIVTVFNMIEKNFYDRLKIKNELSSLTSSSKFLYKILLFIPFIFVLVIIMLNPSYFKPLVNTTIGLVFDGIMVITYFLYIIIVKKIMRIDEV